VLFCFIFIYYQFLSNKQVGFAFIMDDFHAGPLDFTIYIDTLSRTTLTQAHETVFSCSLSKALELYQGQWEVCLKQMLCSPLICPLFIDRDDKHLEIKKGDTIYDIKFEIPVAFDDKLSIIGYIDNFNKSLPTELKDNVYLKFDNGYSLLKIKDDCQITFKSRYLANLFGFQTNYVYPFSPSKEQVEIKSEFPAWLRNGYDIFKVLTDFTAPLIYGDSSLSVLSVGIFPETTCPCPVQLKLSEGYVPVMKSFISTISVKIVDIYNNQVPFIDYKNPIIMKLHFRPRNHLI